MHYIWYFCVLINSPCLCLCVWNLLAGGAHCSPQRGAGQRAWGEEFLPAGERQDPWILGNLKEKPGGGQGWAEEPTEEERGGRRAPPSWDHCEKQNIFLIWSDANSVRCLENVQEEFTLNLQINSDHEGAGVSLDLCCSGVQAEV